MTHFQLPRKYLVLGPSWVGDMVLAQSLFIALRHAWPDCEIEVAAPPWTLPLLERMPEVNAGIALPFKHGQLALGERWRFGRNLRSRGYTHSIMLTNSLKSALLPFAAGIAKRTGFVGEMRYGLLNDIRKLDKTRLPRTVDRFVALAVDDGAPLPRIADPVLRVDSEKTRQTLARLGMQAPTVPVLGLCPGAEYGEAKRWPVEYYAEAAREALAAGWQVWLFGSDKDVPVTGAINALCDGACGDFGGKTKLGEAMDLMALTHTVISNDSGLMHVAAALGRKVVALYGSSSPFHTPPMHPEAVVEYLGVSCSPCFQRSCPLPDPAQQLKCLRGIAPRAVIAHLPLQPAGAPE
jgi:heptosyltransferase-2